MLFQTLFIIFLLLFSLSICLLYYIYNQKNITEKNIHTLEQEKQSILQELQNLKAKEQFYAQISSQLEHKTEEVKKLFSEIARLNTELKFRLTKEEKQILENKVETTNRELIKLQEKISSQNKLEADLKALLETTKLEITNQNRAQYSAISNDLKQYNERQARQIQKETGDNFEKIIEKDVKEAMQKIHENLQLHKETLISHQKPIEFFTKILAGSKESGTHGEQTIVNQLDNMGLKYGIDYFTQVSGKGGSEERLIADVVILVPNSGKKDIIIIDSKSSTKLGSSTKDFIASVDASFSTFAKKDYKTAVEKKIKEMMLDVQINQTHLFIYLPFDRMLSRISEERPALLQKIREKDVGVLTPVILDFLLDTIKLYSAKLEFNNNSEKIMKDVKDLIDRTSKVLACIKDVGKSIDNSVKKYTALQSSVVSRFVPVVNRAAKALEVKKVVFDSLDEDKLKEIELKEES